MPALNGKIDIDAYWRDYFESCRRFMETFEAVFSFDCTPFIRDDGTIDKEAMIKDAIARIEQKEE